MPVTISRTKLGRTHFAVALAPAGNVTAWTEDRAQAGAFAPGAAKAAAEFYAHVANIGELTFLDGDKVLHTTGGPTGFADDAASDADHFRAQAEALGAKLKEEQDYSEELIELNSGLERERDALAAKVKELEAIIASAQ